MENHYIREFVEYYKKLGVKNIYIYDNNDKDGENFSDTINDYISSGYVKIIDYRGKKSTPKFNLQTAAYRDFYRNYAKNYDWLIIIDVDELICIEDGKSICEFLSQDKFKPYDQIRLNWFEYNDNDIIRVENGDYSMEKRFKTGRPSKLGKSIMRAKVEGVIASMHGHGNRALKSCDAAGNPLEFRERASIVNEKPLIKYAWVKHYLTKSLQEFIEIKYKRGYADTNRRNAREQLNPLTYFFGRCKLTREKIDYLKSLNIDTSEYEKKYNEMNNEK